MLHLHYNNKYVLSVINEGSSFDIQSYVEDKLNLQKGLYYLIQNGKISANEFSSDGIIHIVPRLPGGKGGFGSMLRAIGAQIEKTTNREACRDLSGRRLRDINEEKRLKAWIDRQATREQEAADVKQKKLERLCRKPKHEFKDDSYDKERSELPERLEDAVTQGLSAAAGSSKRKHEPEASKTKKKKHALWVDDDLDELSTTDDDKSSSDEDSSLNNSAKAQNVITVAIDSTSGSDSNVNNENEDRDASKESSTNGIANEDKSSSDEDSSLNNTAKTQNALTVATDSTSSSDSTVNNENEDGGASKESSTNEIANADKSSSDEDTTLNNAAKTQNVLTVATDSTSSADSTVNNENEDRDASKESSTNELANDDKTDDGVDSLVPVKDMKAIKCTT